MRHDLDRRWRLPLAAALLAATAGSAWAAVSQAVPPPTVLHLSQTAERRLPRDRLRVEFRAEKRGASPAAVAAAINTLMAQALAAARRVDGITIESGSYTVFRATPENRAALWQGAQSLRLSGADFAALLRLAGTLQADGLAIGDMTYDASPDTLRGSEAALTSEALSALARRAAAIADQLHLVVAGYRNLTVGNAEAADAPVRRFAATAAAASAAMPAPVGAPGEATVRVEVSAEILLSPPRRPPRTGDEPANNSGAPKADN